MRIYNETKSQVLENPDLTKGYLKQDKIVVKTIPTTEEVQEQFHYVTIKEYENGGKDVEKVIDVEYQPAKPESYEYEDIQVYILFTEEQLKNNRIAEIKQRLEELNKDFIQYYLGAVISNIEDKKIEFISLHNELRELLGKEPRIYK